MKFNMFFHILITIIFIVKVFLKMPISSIIP